MSLQVADVKKVLISVDQLNLMGNEVYLNGNRSFIRKTGGLTPVKKVGLNFVFSIWVPRRGTKDTKGMSTCRVQDWRTVQTQD